ncbi:MAG: hypothetical protein ACU0BS_08500 [Hasllibacter sp.]
MRSTIFTSLILLAACAAPVPESAPEPVAAMPGPGDGGESGRAAAEIRAFALEESLSEQVGEDAGGATVRAVTRDGADVAMTVRLSDAVEADAGPAIGEAIAGTFARSLCADAGLVAFFAGGGTLEVTVENPDGSDVAVQPVTSCG